MGQCMNHHIIGADVFLMLGVCSLFVTEAEASDEELKRLNMRQQL